MPRSYDDPDLDDLYLDDSYWEDPYEDVRYERPLSPREAVDALMGRFFPEDEPDDLWYEGPPNPHGVVDEIVQDLIYEEESARLASLVDPQKKAVFNNILARCRSYVKPFEGRIEVTEGYDPGYMDIHIYIGSLVFDNMTDPNFLRDLGQEAHMLIVNPHEDGFHIHISLPFYNLEYWNAEDEV